MRRNCSLQTPFWAFIYDNSENSDYSDYSEYSEYSENSENSEYSDNLDNFMGLSGTDVQEHHAEEYQGEVEGFGLEVLLMEEQGAKEETDYY